MADKRSRWINRQFKNGKKSSAVVTIICLVIFIAGFGAGSVLTMYPDSVIGRWQNYGDPITFIISFVALVFAMITYFSIDAVEKKNKMDNNILETENYTVAYNRILKELDAETEEEYKRKLYDSVKMPDISSCMKYADWLQTIIDRIVFFGYFTWDEKKRKSFIDDIENGCKEYEDIGSGLKLLIVENVNLIRAVVEYQEQRKKNIYSYSFLEDVRGNMLKNPVAKMVYLDYLGLDYHKKAAEVMRYEIDETEFSDEYFKKWLLKGDFENKDKIGVFVSIAIRSFEKAIEISDDDMLWRGYLQYNLARTRVIEYLLSSAQERSALEGNVLQILEECVRTRKNICYMFEKSNSFLAGKFADELDRATKLQKSFVKNKMK